MKAIRAGIFSLIVYLAGVNAQNWCSCAWQTDPTGRCCSIAGGNFDGNTCGVTSENALGVMESCCPGLTGQAVICWT